ncbi:MAG: hypothetical protein PHG56_08315 [Tissierellia bacterium]|nr:hypothetical protein [Tissierellia bacterium]MDD3751438.1 hypothetical protein [Tissierellia bacterium]MDD4047051.1 hypothetical protein [Tissierellia bacterium]
MKCDKCKKNEAKIKLDNTENLCLDCYNKVVSELIGIKDIEDYSKDIYIYDNNGKLRQFSIYHMFFGDKVSWFAKEVNGSYEFSIMEDAYSDQTKAINKLCLKTIKGVTNKTLRESNEGYYIDNALHRGNKQYSLNDYGVIQISDDENGRACFIIDGVEVSQEEFASLLTQFAGFNLEYKIKDITEDIDVFEDKYNYLTDEEKTNYWNKFERILNRFVDNDFISYKLIKFFDEEFWEYTELLKELIQYGNIEFAIDLGQKIKAKLLSIDTDDDSFPEYEIDVINDILKL